MATRNSSAGKNGALDPALPQKKRARRRLVGAAAVCLVAAIVLPIVLDSEPRQAREDVQVRIPSRDTPLRDGDDGAVQGVIGGTRQQAPDTGAARADDAQGGRSAPDADGPGEPLAEAPGDLPSDAREPAAPAAKPPAKAAAGKATDGAPPSLSVPASEAGGAQASTVPKAKTEPRADAKAEAKPELRPEPRPADTRGAFLLQAGAFASEKAALEQLARVRKAGQKAYTEKVSTSQGERIRVRIGPFASRDAAEKARAALKASGVESAVIAP